MVHLEQLGPVERLDHPGPLDHLDPVDLQVLLDPQEKQAQEAIMVHQEIQVTEGNLAQLEYRDLQGLVEKQVPLVQLGLLDPLGPLVLLDQQDQLVHGVKPGPVEIRDQEVNQVLLGHQDHQGLEVKLGQQDQQENQAQVAQVGQQDLAESLDHVVTLAHQELRDQQGQQVLLLL